MKPNQSGPRADTAPPGLQALMAADPLGLVLADISDAVKGKPSEESSERTGRRRKRTAGQQDESETSTAVEAIRAAAKLALMGSRMSDDGDDDDEDDDDDDLGDDMDTEEGSSKRRKLDDGSISSKSKNKKSGGASTSTSTLTEEERRAKKRESNNVKKVKERQRRSKMSESIHELRRLLPQCRDDKKANQSIVMMRAVEYIKHLENLLERALFENQKYRLSLNIQHTPAKPPVTPAPAQAPMFEAPGGYVYPASPSPSSGKLHGVADTRPVFTGAAPEHFAAVSKSSAFAPPPRSSVPQGTMTYHHDHVSHMDHVEDRMVVDTKPGQHFNAVTDQRTSAPSTAALSHTQVKPDPAFSTQHPPAHGSHALLYTTTPPPLITRPQYDPGHDILPSHTIGATYHESRRAAKGMKGQHPGQKQPIRSDWSSKTPMSYQVTEANMDQEMHLAGDIEEVDGEWPLFFQKPYLNSEYAHDNHIVLDSLPADGYGFSYEPDPQQVHPHGAEDASILDYGHHVTR